MHDYPFNPLGKRLDQVTADDLAKLRDVAEGWYVDYKSKVLSLADLAKHMSALANQYGGWLYFGVVEDGGTRTATSFPGISIEESNQLSTKLREATSTHISPPLLYEEKVLSGPSETVGLAEGQAVHIVGIPQGIDPPYIHSTGRVYRRLADHSKPIIAEVDRHAMDVLFERGKSFRTRINERFRRIPELREEQKNASFAYIYLSPDLRLPDPPGELSLSQFRNFCRNKDSAQGGISVPLDQVRVTQFGYAGRQVENNSPEFAGLGIRWWHDGVARIELPINTWTLEQFAKNCSQYRYFKEFGSEMLVQRLAKASICDFSFVVQALAALTNLHSCLRIAVGDTRPLYAACEMRNLFYRVPFFNSSAFIVRCKQDGIPLLTERNIAFPEHPYFDNMLVVGDTNSSSATEASDRIPSDVLPYVKVAGLIAGILTSIGVICGPEDLIDDELYTHPLATRAD